MTTFVAHGTPSGLLYAPDDAVPSDEGRTLPDRLWLGFSPDMISEFTDDQAVEGLPVVRRLRAAADALEARLLERLSTLREDSHHVGDEVAAEMRVASHTAAKRVDRAKELVRRFPRMLELVREGEIDGDAAGRVTHAAAMLSDVDARRLDTELARKLRTGTVGRTDPTNIVHAARRLVEKIDPEAQASRARHARDNRKVELIPGENATATLSGTLPAEVASAAYARLDAMARRLRHGGDTRTLDQLRADIYADLLLGRDPGVTAPTAAAMVYLHMPLTTALTITDHGCELEGTGPIPAPLARDIMTNNGSIWRKIITDPQGVVTGIGTHKYRPNQALRDLIAARDRTCTTPHCHRPAHHSDFDHLTPFSHAGPTTHTNSGPKCTRHHHLRDLPGWRVDYDPLTGTGSITTPTGRTYTKHRQPLDDPPTTHDTENTQNLKNLEQPDEPPF